MNRGVHFTPNFSWVLPDRLAAGGLPARGMSWEAHRAYEELAAAGVRVVASMLKNPQPDPIIAAAGLLALHFPVGDFGTPRDPDAFAAFIDAVHSHILEGRPVLAHCYAGVGRAGMFAASYLARHAGYTPGAAITEVRRLRPHSIETPGQVHIVRLMALGPP